MKTIPLILLTSVSSLHAAVYNYNVSADNDMALYTGNATGSSLVQYVEQTGSWEVPNVGTFVSSDDYVYVVGMNFTLQASFAGFINTIDLSTVAWEVSSDISGSLTGFAGDSTAFNPLISEISALIATETYTPASLTGDTVTGVGIAGVANTVEIPDGNQTAYIFRTLSTNIVPEPSTTLLGFGTAAFALFRRRRNAA